MSRLPVRLAWLICLFPLVAQASNGLNLIGYGAESVAMAGADVAIAADSLALNTNPAGIARLGPRAFDLHNALAHALDVAHADGFGNDRSVSNRFIPAGGMGYVRRPEGSRCAWGVAFFGQGGAGFVYEDLNTLFGTVDELSSLVRIARLSPGLACETDGGVHVGGALALNHADIRQKVFPGTSVGSFFGSDLRDASGWGATVKLGVLVPFSDTLTVGASFTPKVRLALRGGRLVSNQTGAGRGLVTYREVEIDGLALPDEASLGVAWRLDPDWLVSAELTWLDWSGAATRSTLTATRPDDPAAPPISATSTLDWRDQFVLALGVAWRLDPTTTLYARLNGARNPIPPGHLSPLLAIAKGFGQIVPAAHSGAVLGAAAAISRKADYVGARYVAANFNGGSSLVKSATAIDGAWSTVSLATLTALYDQCQVGGKIVFTGDSGINHTADGSTLTYVNVSAGKSYVNAAAKPDGSLAVIIKELTAAAGNIATSSDGATWTARTPSGATGGSGEVYSVGWSPCASAWVMAKEDGTVYTSANGYDFTARTAPVIVENRHDASSRYIASSATSTLIAHAGGDLLRTTDGTTWTLITTADLFSGLSESITFTICHVGGAYWLTADNGWLATSTDDGLTWARHYGLVGGGGSNEVNFLGGVNGKILALTGDGHVNEYTTLAAPTHIGVVDASTDLANPYLRIM
jgi:long-chain fatty acid transport protein